MYPHAMKMMQICAGLLVGLAQLSSCEMSSFRGTLQNNFGEVVLRGLGEALGSVDHRKQTEQQLHEFEAELQTTFKALPKNSRGALERPYARYALHRLFVQRYGWQVKGLEMTSGAWYSGEGVDMMGDRLPPKMRELFETRLSSKGLVLQELAVLAATLDAMFRNDVYDRLGIVYAALGLNKSDILSMDQGIRIGHAYMSTLIVGNQVEELHERDVLLSDRTMRELGRYDSVVALLNNTLIQVAGAIPDSFEWELMASWLLEFGKQLGHHEDDECQVMKHKLLPLEANAGTGRVRFSDFCNASDLFAESFSDLRGMAALDETDPDDPKVIIPNYLQGATNCISPAGYYSICCFDECEALMDKIEAHFEAPSASPSAVASFVASLPSDSQPANRSLAPELLQALELLAMDEGRMVPLHSKHFAQWMHQAYPRECSHPQQSDKDRFNQSLRFWMDELKAYHADINGIAFSTQKMQKQGQSTAVSYEFLITCVMSVVGLTFAKVFRKIGQSSQGKALKQL